MTSQFERLCDHLGRQVSNTSDIDSKPGTTYAQVDWDEYVQYRPNQYHTSPGKNAGSERFVDVGSGNGIASTSFVPDFKVVHLLDPSSSNQAQAKRTLGAFIDKNKPQTKLESTVSTAENAPETLASSADLVICATTAHFVDPDNLIESAARMLRPGGTLAIYSYTFPYFPEQSHGFNEAFYKVINYNLSLCAPDEKSKAILESGRTLNTGQGILDSVPVPEKLFTDTRRVYLNGEAGKKGLALFIASYCVPVAPTERRATETEQRLSFKTGQDTEAEG